MAQRASAQRSTQCEPTQALCCRCRAADARGPQVWAAQPAARLSGISFSRLHTERELESRFLRSPRCRQRVARCSSVPERVHPQTEALLKHGDRKSADAVVLCASER